MCGKPELLDRCCVHQTRGLSVFGNSRQRRDAVQALPRRHAWVVTGVLHTSPCGVDRIRCSPHTDIMTGLDRLQGILAGGLDSPQNPTKLVSTNPVIGISSGLVSVKL